MDWWSSKTAASSSSSSANRTVFHLSGKSGVASVASYQASYVRFYPLGYYSTAVM